MTAKRRAQGEGGITQRKNGLYVGFIELPRDPVTGKRRRKQVSSMDHKALVKKLNTGKRALEDTGDLPTGSETLAKYLGYWLTSVTKVRPMTFEGYRSGIEQYIIPAIGKIKIDQLTPADIRRVEHYVVDTKKLSPTTAHNAYQVLAKALKDAEREGRITRNVARLVDAPRKAVPQLNVLTAPEAIKVLESVQYDRLGSRWATALLTGQRQGECLGIEIERLDFRKNELDMSWQLQRIPWKHGCGKPTIAKDGTRTWPCSRKRGTDCERRRIDAPSDWEHRHVTGGLYLSRPKSRAGWRVIPLVDPLRTILERRVMQAELEPNPHGLLWTAGEKKGKGGSPRARAVFPLDGSPIDPAKDNAAWHDILDRAEVPQMRLHDARHTAVTLLYDLGIPEAIIQQIVGQSTISVTRGYRHRTIAPAAEALTQLSGLLSPGWGEKPIAAIEA